MTQRVSRVVVIAGPTATGKSDLALDLAEAFGGVIINADSQQRYRDFPILTAQPSAADQARVPHRLFSDLAADDVGNAAEWAGKAVAEIRIAEAERRVPIVVGGTGLYFRALMQGLADVPPIPDEVRMAGRALLADIGNAAFHRLLAERDPAGAARIAVGNTQRLSRAWEVIAATGTPLSDWQAAPTRPAIDAAFLSILVLPSRDEIVAACAARFAGMLRAGALREVEAAVTKGIPADAPAMNALGARELAEHLAGRLDLAHAVEGAEIATRQYAKRQSTWFRHQFNSNLTLGARYTGAVRTQTVRSVGDFLKELS